MPKIESNTERHSTDRIQITAQTRMPSVQHADVVAKANEASNASKIAQVATGSTPEGQPIPQVPSEKTDASIAQLARREKQLHAERKRLQAEKAELDKLKAMQLQSQPQPQAVPGRLTKQELQQAIAKGEISYEDLSELYLAQGTQEDQATAQLKAQLTELQAKYSKLEEQVNTAPIQAREQAIKQIDREVSTLVNNNPAYEVIKHQGAQNAVTQLIAITYDETGELMDVEEAARQVETYLEEQALAMSKLNKIQAKLRPQDAQEPQSDQAPKKQPQSTKQSAAPASISRGIQTNPQPTRTPEQERRWRAEQAFYGRLKK